MAALPDPAHEAHQPSNRRRGPGSSGEVLSGHQPHRCCREALGELEPTALEHDRRALQHVYLSVVELADDVALAVHGSTLAHRGFRKLSDPPTTWMALLDLKAWPAGTTTAVIGERRSNPFRGRRVHPHLG
jgi:hypothetical protein